jgi:hypothetical protein
MSINNCMSRCVEYSKRLIIKDKIMAKISKQADKHIKYFKCEICLKNIPIEYYFTVGDSITCDDCKTEYILQSKSPLELTRQEVDYSKIDFDEPY